MSQDVSPTNNADPKKTSLFSDNKMEKDKPSFKPVSNQPNLFSNSKDRWQQPFPDFYDKDEYLKYNVTDDEIRKKWLEETEEKKEDFELAKKKCPRLYVEPEIFDLERSVLARNLKIQRIGRVGLMGFFEKLLPRNPKKANIALLNFNCFISKTNELPERYYINENAAYLWLLDNYKQILSKAKTEKTPWEENETTGQKFSIRRQNLIKEMELLLTQFDLTKRGLNDLRKKLFLEICPESLPTFQVKFKVIRHPNDRNFRCIEYFFYWPVQVLPHHFLDYEPVYVYVYKLSEDKYATVAVLFNGVPGFLPKLKDLSFSLLRKRPGHQIRMFFNSLFHFRKGKSVEYLDHEIPFWNFSDSKEYDEYDKLAKEEMEFPYKIPDFNFEELYEWGEFMREAYGGQYAYEKRTKEISSNPSVIELIDKDNFVSLCIPRFLRIPVYWHAFDKCSAEILDKYECVSQPILVPLEKHDLIHIEWNVSKPFQAPFLYPLVGGKDPLMHYPIDALDFADYDYQMWIWREFCKEDWEFTGLGCENLIRMGKLIEFLSYHQNKNKEIIEDLWKKIDAFRMGILYELEKTENPQE